MTGTFLLSTLNSPAWGLGCPFPYDTLPHNPAILVVLPFCTFGLLAAVPGSLSSFSFPLPFSHVPSSVWSWPFQTLPDVPVSTYTSYTLPPGRKVYPFYKYYKALHSLIEFNSGREGLFPPQSPLFVLN